MGASLAFIPVRPQRHTVLSDELLYIFTEKYDLNGSTHRMDNSAMSYLEGLKDAGSTEIKKDIQKLINAIEKYGEIDIYLQH